MTTYPATAAQRQLWFLDRHERTGSAYSTPILFRLSGGVNASLLGSAVDVVAARHDALRTSFREDGLDVVAEVHAPVPDLLEVVDLTGVSPSEAEAEAQRLVDRWVHEPLDLTSGTLIRARLVVVTGDSALLLLLVHHIAVDAWSEGVVLDELQRAYNGDQLLPLPLTDADAATELRRREEELEKNLDDGLAYWREELADAPTALELPPTAKSGASPYEGDRVSFQLPEQSCAAVAAACRRLRVTPFVLLLTAYAVTLGKIANEDDLVIGAPVMRRDDEDFDSVVGNFVNSVAIRVRLGGDPDLRTVVQRVSEVVIGAIDNRDLPFESVVRGLDPSRRAGVSPLFQAMFWMNSLGDARLRLDGLTVTPLSFPFRISKFDVVLDARQNGRRFDFVLEYRKARISDEAADQLRRRFLTVLDAVATRDDLTLAELDVVCDEERALLNRWGGAGEEVTQERMVDLLREVAAADPDRPAVRDAVGVKTYRQLWNDVVLLAGRLARAGLVPGGRVAACTTRTSAVIAVPLAVWLCDATYVPLDRRHPDDRLHLLLGDAEPDVVVVDEITRDRIVRVAAGSAAAIVPLGAQKTGATPPVHTPASGIVPAYLLYTSGTTGVPKGVVVGHGSLTNLLREIVSIAELDRADVVLAATTVTFDISMVELFTPLLLGGCVVIASEGQASDPVKLGRLVADTGVTVIQATPGVWEALAPRLTGRLRVALCGGEKMTPTVRDRLLTAADVALNLYGPTETTVWSSAWRVDRAPIRVGRPLHGNRFVLRDRWGSAAPPGTTGELFIGGGALALGYHRRPDLTAAAFTEAPAEPGGRLYRTGDLGRWDGQGRLELVGRGDDQLKVSGHRIEPGEIEHRLQAVEEVLTCAVVPVSMAGMTGLAAVVVPTSPLPAGTWCPADADLAGKLTAHARAMLPPSMVPAHYVVTDALPRAVSGKTNRRQLAERVAAGLAEKPTGAYRLPVDVVETLVTEGLSALLGIEISAEESFFRRGGNSLGAAIAVGRLSDELHHELDLDDLYQHPSPRRLAELIRGRSDGLLRRVTLRSGEGGPRLLCLAGTDQGLIELRDHLADLPVAQADAFSSELRAEQPDLAIMLDRACRDLAATSQAALTVLAAGATGCRLATHVVPRLVEAGVPVTRVVLIDPAGEHHGLDSSSYVVDVLDSGTPNAGILRERLGRAFRLRRAVHTVAPGVSPVPVVILLSTRDTRHDRAEIKRWAGAGAVIGRLRTAGPPQRLSGERSLSAALRTVLDPGAPAELTPLPL
ncbi:amino acid adenylation domain-containing protein [Actinoplanes sp. NPDC048791]|uniref:non-ribosomal peptide synthetase n=1 Tax=Actinoplanes sp. NPDC048791 TaxID=3154623 RepID=UPI0033FD84D3